MTYGNLGSGAANLAEVFGVLSPELEGVLVRELCGVDEDLAQLASDASDHLGCEYRHVRLGQFGSNIAGGGSGDGGDLWFELDLERSQSRLRWRIQALFIVFCDRQFRGEAVGYSCTHNLMTLESYAFAPQQTVRILAQHINVMRSHLLARSPQDVRGLPHDQLVD